jgi:ubiquitin C-terminal hydrolase
VCVCVCLARWVYHRYKVDVNKDNVLGTKGNMVKAFAEFVAEIWNNKYTSVIPRNIKRVISDYAPQFSGYQQHDAQELIAFLLDKMHEDLNVAGTGEIKAQHARSAAEDAERMFGAHARMYGRTLLVGGY